MVMEKSPALVKMRVFNQVSGAPYSDCFNPEEEWIICSTEADSPKCVIRHCIYINFHTSSMMRSVITSKACGAQQANFNSWAEWIKSNISRYYDAEQVREDIQLKNEQARQAIEELEVQESRTAFCNGAAKMQGDSSTSGLD